MLKVGDTCPVGGKIATILGKNEVVCVYTTEAGELRWNYAAAHPDGMSDILSKFDFLMSDVKYYAPKTRKKELYNLLGKALFAALNETNVEESLRHLSGFEEYFGRVTIQIARTKTISVCIALSAACLTCLLLFAHGAAAAHAEYIYGASFGVVGACISVMQRVKNLEIDWRSSGFYLFLQACIRIILGLLFGAIFVIACKADFLFGNYKDEPKALYLLCIVAGFSERMIPELFSKLDSNDE